MLGCQCAPPHWLHIVLYEFKAECFKKRIISHTFSVFWNEEEIVCFRFFWDVSVWYHELILLYFVVFNFCYFMILNIFYYFYSFLNWKQGYCYIFPIIFGFLKNVFWILNCHLRIFWDSLVLTHWSHIHFLYNWMHTQYV